LAGFSIPIDDLYLDPSRCDDRAFAEEVAKMNVHFTNRLDEPAIAQGAGIDRLEAYRLGQGRYLAFGSLVIPGNKHLEALALAASAGSSWAKMVLNAFTTLALGASVWISSAAEVV
jgi:hypothetical protein